MFVPTPSTLARNDAPASSSTGGGPQGSVPFASAVYSANGLVIQYTMKLQDEVNDIEWLTSNRYSQFRNLHKTVGRFITKASFPPMMLTSRGNRDKNEIELRRRRLEAYLTSLFASLCSPGQPISLSRAQKILSFIDYPFADDLIGSSNTLDLDCQSSGSETTAAGERISVLEQDTLRTTATPPPSVVTTRWRAPPLLPGPKLGLTLPYVSLTQTITGAWDVVVKADRSMRKGFLRHRYDEAVAMCNHTSKMTHILDSVETQEFIMDFRKRHPLTAYLTYEKSLACTTPTSANRVDRSSSPMDSSGGSDGGRGCDDDDIEVGSPVVHHHRNRSVEPEDAARRLFPSLRTLDTYSPEYDDSRLQLGLHYTLQPNPMRRQSSGSTRAFVDAVRGNRVAGCCCTKNTFCSTSDGSGDVYTTHNGFAILVCPPPTVHADHQLEVA
ncbi:Hypothetical protein, putative [Bodo saltans]|uniref:PX domain-containing protein n=1 Tax=Bodo saltans TaxID=75058 RepID=A0A0S4JU41_BODSA|nr:Hypothetical protein, putative [Bodo saltans]|eukprot:CUG93747.1 Hypothetical protein, putative [Bodo saltans]